MTDFKDMKFKITRDCDRGFCHRGCGRQDKQLNAYDWLDDEKLYVYVSQEAELAAFTDFFMNRFAKK